MALLRFILQLSIAATFTYIIYLILTTSLDYYEGNVSKQKEKARNTIYLDIDKEYDTINSVFKEIEINKVLTWKK